MNRKEINLMDMITTVIKFLRDNLSFITQKPAIGEIQAQIESNVAEIETLNKAQTVNSKVDSEIKKKARTDTVTTALKVTAALAAHAALSKDIRLKAIADVSESSLKNMRDSDFITKLETICDAVLPLVLQLAIWGVNQADVDLLNTQTAFFKQQNPAIRNVVIKSKQATTDIKARITETNNLIKESLDPMMSTFKQANPSFHSEYLSARIIIDKAATQKAEDKPPVV